MKLKIVISLIAAAVLTACASPGGPRGQKSGADGGMRAGGAASITRPSALLARARDLQARQGCARAAPSYRVIAAFGEGYEVAQYELGACLLEIDGASAEETALFRNESLFWLRRAAWAGNPRAQGKLATVLSGAPAQLIAQIAPDPVEAMMWAIVYDGNGVRGIYNLPDMNGPVADHLDIMLDAAGLETARRRAGEFHKIEMASFIPPQAESGQQSDGAEAAQSEGRRPRQ